MKPPPTVRILVFFVLLNECVHAVTELSTRCTNTGKENPNENFLVVIYDYVNQITCQIPACSTQSKKKKLFSKSIISTILFLSKISEKYFILIHGERCKDVGFH